MSCRSSEDGSGRRHSHLPREQVPLRRPTRTVRQKDIQLSAMMPGDVNPAHEEFAKSDVFHKIVAHGMQGDRAKKLMTRG
jgi:acyl dehydratase